MNCKKVLKVVYNDCDSSFNERLEKANENTIHILEKGNKNTIHVKNIHILMTEIYKFLNGLFPYMSKILKKRITHTPQKTQGH